MWDGFESKGATGTQYDVVDVNPGHIQEPSDAAAGAISRFVKGDVGDQSRSVEATAEG
jgi:hypothetical protein